MVVRRKWRAWVTGLFTLVGFTLSQSASGWTLSEVEAVLMEPTQYTVTREYSEVRWLAKDALSLKSEGELTITPEGTLTWAQTEPFRQTLTFTETALTLQVEDDPAETIQKATHPEAFVLVDFMRSLMGGNLKAVEATFEVALTDKAGAWVLTLTPKASDLRRFIQTVTLRGKDSLTFVRLADPKGNLTTVNFDHPAEP